jgi:nicotinamide-nucleotide amidase
VGTELVTGLRTDTNGPEIARALSLGGYRVEQMVSVPDSAQRIRDAITQLLPEHALLVVTGGLGPTHDDVTREAVAAALGRGIVRDEALIRALEARMPAGADPAVLAARARQADVIEGARVLPATVGTAPGQIIEHGTSTLVLLPGPPHEMRPMLAAFLNGRSPGIQPVRLRCAGITESQAAVALGPALAHFPEITLTLLAAPGEVEVILFAAPGEDAATRLQAAGTAARTALGGACYTQDGESLAEAVLRLARKRGLQLAVAESCTGGRVAAELTAVPGASEVFVGGVVAYANATKEAALGVQHATLKEHGAVSEPVARAMAAGALALPGADVAVAITGIAGPGGGSADKPVGLVWLCCAARDGAVRTERSVFAGQRPTVTRRATVAALDLLRRVLQEA